MSGISHFSIFTFFCGYEHEKYKLAEGEVLGLLFSMTQHLG